MAASAADHTLCESGVSFRDPGTPRGPTTLWTFLSFHCHVFASHQSTSYKLRPLVQGPQLLRDARRVSTSPSGSSPRGPWRGIVHPIINYLIALGIVATTAQGLNVVDSVRAVWIYMIGVHLFLLLAADTTTPVPGTEIVEFLFRISRSARRQPLLKRLERVIVPTSSTPGHITSDVAIFTFRRIAVFSLATFAELVLKRLPRPTTPTKFAASLFIHGELRSHLLSRGQPPSPTLREGFDDNLHELVPREAGALSIWGSIEGTAGAQNEILPVPRRDYQTRELGGTLSVAMAMGDPRAIVEQGERIYAEKYQKDFEAHYRGQYAVIDVKTGSAYRGSTADSALKTAREAAPTGVFHLIRIGDIGAFRSSTTNANLDWIFSK